MSEEHFTWVWRGGGCEGVRGRRGVPQGKGQGTTTQLQPMHALLQPTISRPPHLLSSVRLL